MENNEDNTIIELSKTTEDTLYDEEEIIQEDKEILKVSKKKKNKIRKNNFWNDLSKNKKITLIVIGSLIVLLIIMLIVYFVFLKKDKPKLVDEPIVVEKDNYIYDNGILKILDSKEEEIGKYECKKKDAETCYIAKITNEDSMDIPRYQDTKGKELVRSSKIYDNKYVFIQDDDNVILYDFVNNKDLSNYKLIKLGNVDKPYIVVKDDKDKYGVIEITEDNINTIVEFKYDYLALGSSTDTFVTKVGNNNVLINAKGDVLITLSGTIKSFNSKYVALYKDSYYYLYDYEANQMLEESFDYIDFDNDYIITINNKKVFVYDAKLNKVNEEALKLKNTYYRTIYVFDKTLLKETKKAYDIVVDNNYISFVINEDITLKINLNEYRLSSKYDYVKYYDGTLYFFSDKDKKNLLGKYTCDFENNATESSAEFENCFIARESNLLNELESVGFAPIINNEYVFISDSKTGAENKTIKLFTINGDSESTPKYQKIDTGLSQENITYTSITNNLVMAVNSKGNTGVITFGPDGPSGVIAFQDEDNGGNTISITPFMDDYLLAKREEGYYLFTKLGELITSSKFEIVDFDKNYVVVKNTNFIINNKKTGKTIGSGFNYIKMYDDYFVGIKDGKLNLYKYEESAKPLLTDTIKISGSNDYSSSYTITKDKTIVIETKNPNGSYEYNLDYTKKTSDVSLPDSEKESIDEG